MLGPVVFSKARRGLDRCRAACAALLLATLFAAIPVNADDEELIALINDYRAAPQHCDGWRTRPVRPLVGDRRLATERVSSERQLERALQRSGYQALRVQVLAVSGARDSYAALDALAQYHCDALLSPHYSEVGVSRRGGSWQLVLAQPLRDNERQARPDWQAQRDRDDRDYHDDREDRDYPEYRGDRDDPDYQEDRDAPAYRQDRGGQEQPQARPDPQGGQAAGREILQRVNAARAVARTCGTRRFKAAPALSWNTRLAETALAHSSDMANRNYFSHTSKDGSQLKGRVERSGYNWRGLGENIAAGQTSAQQAVSVWLASPGHCANIMGPQFTEMGAAYALNPRVAATHYWTQVFGAPR